MKKPDDLGSPPAWEKVKNHNTLKPNLPLSSHNLA